MPLNSTQLEAIKALDWLLGTTLSQRRTGRTTAQAVALIRYALQNPRQTLYVTDHAHAAVGSYHVNSVLYQRVQDLVVAHNLSGFRWNGGRHTVVYEGPIIPNWLPEEVGRPLTESQEGLTLWDHLDLD